MSRSNQLAFRRLDGQAAASAMFGPLGDDVMGPAEAREKRTRPKREIDNAARATQHNVGSGEAIEREQTRLRVQWVRLLERKARTHVRCSRVCSPKEVEQYWAEREEAERRQKEQRL